MQEDIMLMFTGMAKVSATLDGWTSPFQDDFLGVTVHWINNEWRQRELVISFEPLSGSHTGENLCAAFIKVLDRFKLGTKLHTVTTDNASNMTKMMTLLETHAMTHDW